MVLDNKLAVASLSLGLHPSHTLDAKIKAAAHNHFKAIEIVYSDLEAHSTAHSLNVVDGARQIADICAENGLEILSLCPFMDFEGYNSPLSLRLNTAQHWMEVCRALGATYFQVPSQSDDNSIGDEHVIVEELRQLADLGAASDEPPVYIAYEALAWGKYINLWEESLHIVEAVNRPNFGVCLDIFHIAAKLWGDNQIPQGKLPDGEKALQQSLDLLVKKCPLEKLYYVQLSDGELFDPPLSPEHPLWKEGEPPGLTWSLHARPFPLETELGGYFPVVEMTRAVLKGLGYKGYISLEVFDRRMREEANGPEHAASRGFNSWQNLIKAVKKQDGNKL
ncbi:MAG: hypothetical protein M1834_006756 [Cirrosporium novae-zelandiae]|nr:MAG: hypothetical protein M1834_006756 [Cirrosporium novae-zelandiae]